MKVPRLKVQLLLPNGEVYESWAFDRDTPERLADDLAVVAEGIEDAAEELFFGD